MKKIYILVLSVFSFFQSFSQTASAVIFSEAGEKFTLFLNGEKQNEVPQSNVKLRDLAGEFYQARIDFEDVTLADFSNNNFAVQKGIESTYIVKRNKKGEYLLRFHSQAEISGASAASAASPSSDTYRIADVDDDAADSGSTNASTKTTVTTKSAAASGSENVAVGMNMGGVNMGMNVNIEDDNTAVPTEEEFVDIEKNVEGGSNVTTTKTTTTTTNKTKPAAAATGENISMGVNLGGINMGVNVKVQDNTGGTNMDVEEDNVTSVTTTTTSKTTTTSGSKSAPAPKPQPVVVESASAGTCAGSMTDAAFASAKANIESKSFEDSKMTVAKQITKSNCLTATQIKLMMGLFSFEESKLAYAKYAYDFCYNQGDYYIVNDAFTFESSIEDLNEFLESK